MAVVLKNYHEERACAVKEEPSIEEIRTRLGLDRCRPIIASPSDIEDMEEKGDAFAGWYEEELRKFFKEITE